jgi:large repetitive protein
MDPRARVFRLRAFHERVVRVVAGTVGASLLLLAVPTPAAAAPTPKVTITDVAVTEGTGAAVSASFTIQVAPRPAACCPLQVSWATAPGSASAADFTSSSGTASLTKTTPTRVVSVPVIGDPSDEPIETFVVNLSNLTGSPGSILDAQGVATITDDDAPPLLSVNDASVTEGNAGPTTATFTASLSTASGNPVTFNWTTVAGSATAGVDYVAASGSRTIAAGTTTATIGITVNGDLLAEGNESFGITLSGPANATIGDGSGLGTITDDEPLPTLSVIDVSVAEGNVGTITATFTVALSPAVANAVTFNWTTAAGSATAGVDYVAASGVGSIAAAATSTTFGITVNGDVLDEVDENFGVTLSNPSNALIGDGSGLGTITDDDPVPSLSLNDASVTEGNAGTTTATFTVTLSAASAKTVTLDWTTAAGSATAGVDYVAGTGSRTILPGATTATVAITVNGDVLDELDETFGITLSNPSNATIVDGAGLATITDDDLPPTLSVDNVSVVEGDAGTTTATFTATLSAMSSKTITFDWATAAGSATPGVDYAAAGTTGTITAGSTGLQVVVTVSGDLLDELDETFGVTLTNPSNATIADGSGLGTIADDDLPPTLSVNDASVTEGNAGTTTATFTAILSATSGKTVTVAWTTGDDDATELSDYMAGSGTLTFVPGDTSESIPVSVLGDVTAELDETFHIILATPSNATIADGSGLGTITDDELLAVVDIDEPTLVEGQSGTATLGFSVTLSHQATFPVTVDWNTTAGTATSDIDYVSDSGTVTFAPMDTSETVWITVYGDTTYERNETLMLDLSNGQGAPIGDVRGIGTITDDDNPPIASVANASVVEGNSDTSLLHFTVSLTGTSDVAASVDYAVAGTTATAGSDFVATSGTLTIPAGMTSGSIDVAVNGDVAVENNETLILTLTTPTDATLGDATALGTIVNNDKATTTLTLRVVRKPSSLIAKGLLEPAKAGERVTATLYRKKGTRFVKVSAKKVPVRFLKDRDGDGKTDGSYSVTFVRPRTQGTFKVVVRFKGSASSRPSSRTRVFTLAS